MKIRPVGAALSHADRRKDKHDETNCRFSQFCGSSKKKERERQTERNICYALNVTHQLQHFQYDNILV